VVALTDVQVLRVSARVMAQVSAMTDPAAAGVDHQDPSLPLPVRSSRLFQAFCQHHGEEAADVLPIPDVSRAIREVFDRQGGGGELGRLVAWDPVLSARLIGQANNPLYFPEQPIHQFNDAVKRIGNRATKHLLVTWCVRKVSHYRRVEVQQSVRRWWKASVFRAAVCQLLAADYSSLDPQAARLAGLVADIGELPFLGFADGFPAAYWNSDELERALPWVRPALGADLLRRWNFPEALAEIPLHARDWQFQGEESLTLADLVILANSLVAIGTPTQARQPAIDSLPGWAKLGNGGITPIQALQLLHKARAMVTQLSPPGFEGRSGTSRPGAYA